MTSTSPGWGRFPLNRPGWRLEAGEGRCRVQLLAFPLGDEMVVCLYNEAAHLGAAAVGEYDAASGRASVSVITRPGHKDDAVAAEAAHAIAKATKHAVCVMAGIHLDRITPQEIAKIGDNCRRVVEEVVAGLTLKG